MQGCRKYIQYFVHNSSSSSGHTKKLNTHAKPLQVINGPRARGLDMSARSRWGQVTRANDQILKNSTCFQVGKVRCLHTM